MQGEEGCVLEETGEEGCVPGEREEEGCVLEEETGEEGCVLGEREEEGCVLEEETGEEECVLGERGEEGCVLGDLEPEGRGELEADGDLGGEQTVDSKSEESAMEEESSEATGGAGIGGDLVRQPGPTRDLGSKTPAEVYQELLTPEIADHILVETNRYADQYVDSHSNYLEVHPRARAHDFIRSPFSLVEIYK